MKKTLFAFLIMASSFCSAAELNHTCDQKTADRIYALELTVEALVERVEWLTKEVSKTQGNKPRSSLTIAQIDDWHNKIKLSNGNSYYYSYSLRQSIAHWLIGQSVKLEASTKTGYVKMVNLETNDFLEVYKDHY